MIESHRQEIAKLEALYASNPGGRVFVHLAEALRKGGEYERARSILEEGLARHPEAASGHVVMGRVLMDMGAAESAEAAFRTVLELDGGNLVALRCLGDLARTQGRRDEAVERYRELVARNPSSEDVAAIIRELEEQVPHGGGAAVEEDQWSADTALDGDAEPADNVAPGHAGRAVAAEPEFGDVDFSALPGDLASFAGFVAPPGGLTADEAEPEPRGLEDDVVELIESSAAPLELEELEGAYAATPAEINPLSALPELDVPEDVAFEPAAEGWSTEAGMFVEPEHETADLDLTDLGSADEEVAEPANLDLSDLFPSPVEIEEAPLDLTLLAPPADEVAEAAPLAIDDLIAADDRGVDEPSVLIESAWSEPAAETAEPWAEPASETPAEAPIEIVDAWAKPELAEPAETIEAWAEPGSAEPAETVEAWAEPVSEEPADTVDAWAEPVSGEPAETVEAWAEPVSEEPADTVEAWAEPVSGEPVDTVDAWAEPVSGEPVDTVDAWAESASEAATETGEPWVDWATAPEIEAEISLVAGFDDEMAGAPIDVGGVEAPPDFESAEAAAAMPDPLAILDAEAEAETLLPEPEQRPLGEAEAEPVEPAPEMLPLESADVYDMHLVSAEPFVFELADAARVDETVPLADAWQADAEPIAAEDEAAEEVAVVEVASGDVVTETLADLYLAQGFAQRASEVYRALLRDRPDDAELAAKLRQAEAARVERTDAADDRGEVWLRGVESAWTGGAGAAGGETTPYTWTEREEREEGIGIAAYLRGLLSWGGSETSPAPERPAEAEETPAAAESVAADTSWEPTVESSWTPEPEPWAIMADEPDSLLESRAVEPGAATDDAVPWSMTPEPVLEEEWGARDEAVTEEPWSSAAEPPADPWLAPEPSAVSGPTAPAPVAPDDPVEAAFSEWFDEPSGAGTTQPEPPEPAATASAGEPATTAAEDDEDEDLEMFRAWLQSLKK